MRGIEANACWKTLGRVMKMSDGPLSGLMPTENAAGKIIRPARMAMKVSMAMMLAAERTKLVWREK